ncbi:MAG: GntR family transcriptional regulator [Clostridia bacterium]|nr:GntR family transcriptional regulator [Clostridia bacterium]
MSSVPLYKKIYEQLRTDIVSNRFPEKRLPSEQQLAAQYQVSIITVKHALSMLSEERIIKRTPGVGTFITVPPFPQEEAVSAPFNIGLVAAHCSDAFGTLLIQTVSEEARRHGCGLLLGIGYTSQQEESDTINHLIQSGARGIIIISMHAQSYNVELLRHAIDSFPLVLADRDLEGLNVPFVGSDHDQAAYDATSYLLSLGHRRIAFLSVLATNDPLNTRKGGYIRAFAEHGFSLDASLIMSGLHSSMPEFKKEGTAQDIQKIIVFLRQHPDVSAIVAANSHVAVLAEEALRLMDKEIPRDMSIVCFDAFDSRIKKSHFTHIRQNERKIAQLAFEQLYRSIQGKPTQRRSLVETELVIGRSTALYSGR